MPYVSYDNISQPAADQRIWRYTDLIKLIDLLNRRQLYFSRIPALADEDPYEGRITDADAIAATEGLVIPDDVPPHLFKSAITDGWKQMNETTLKTMFINCWHAQRSESMAMWKIYAPRGIGVAIASTHARLVSSITEDGREITTGLVKYIDRSSTAIQRGHFLEAALAKRDAFRHEDELRALMWQATMMEAASRGEALPAGLHVACDIEKLIEEIRVPPSSPVWYLEVVRATVQKFGINVSVLPSQLDE